MIKRYTRPEMGSIFTTEQRYRFMLEVELAAARAMHKLGIVPDEDIKVIVEKANFNVGRVDEIEKTTRHDVIAFLTSVAEFVGPPARWLHWGMTSSDVLDTATSLQLKKAGELILTGLKRYGSALARQAVAYKYTLCMGRSHGIHAEPTTMGLKFALWYDENQRNITRLQQAIEAVSVGMISGAVGNYAHLSPQVEEIACSLLGLNPVNIATQVIQRDRHAQFLNALAMIAASLEKVAVEIRHLQRTEVLEAQEQFGSGQKGSSAMPHKRNPIVSEQVTGLARLMRSNAHAAMENIALWHERDISHSSVERVILPDSCILADYELDKMSRLIENLVVFPANMRKNVELTNGLIFSQVVLLTLAQKGMSREDAYLVVQRNAMTCWETKTPFRQLLEQDQDLDKWLTEEDLDEIFSFDRYIENVDYVFKRVGIDG